MRKHLSELSKLLKIFYVLLIYLYSHMYFYCRFQAEVGRVMDIIINSLYSDKDIFLRELVSNAADACDKKRFLSVTADAAQIDLSPPQIKIKTDVENQLVIIEDTGVGMTRDELVNNLGRIAQSGTKNFVEALGEGNADVNLIGQFGT